MKCPNFDTHNYLYYALVIVHVLAYNIYGGDKMLKYKINVLEALKANGLTTYKIRKDKLLSESTLQKLRERKPISWENIESICKMLDCQPNVFLEYEREV